MTLLASSQLPKSTYNPGLLVIGGGDRLVLHGPPAEGAPPQDLPTSSSPKPTPSTTRSRPEAPDGPRAEHPGGLCFHLTGVHLGTIRVRLRQELNISGNVILLNPLEKFNNHSRKNENGKT